MEESAGSGAPSNSNGRFQARTLGRQSGVTSKPEPSAKLLLCYPLAALDPLGGSWSLEGWTSPSPDVSFPAFLSLFLFFSKGSVGETHDGRGVGGQGLTATLGVVPSTWDSSRASRFGVFLCSTTTSRTLVVSWSLFTRIADWHLELAPKDSANLG